MIKKCPKCGAEYPEKLLYCVNCGKKLVYEYSEYTYDETKNSSNKWKWLAAIVAIAAILVGGGAFLFFKMKTPKFAYITNDEVTIHNSPSVSSQTLMTHFENEGNWSYCWAYDANDERSIVYRDNGSIVQLISKQDDWFKVRFYPENGISSHMSDDGTLYIEGWINCDNLKRVEPIKLTWDNLPTVIGELECYNIVDDANVRQTVFNQDYSEGLEDRGLMLYGNIESNHINYYGSSEDLRIMYFSDEEVNGIEIKKEDNCKVLHYESSVALLGIEGDCPTPGINMQKCTPQMREQIYKSISNKPYSRRYYFNIGEGNEEDIRSFEMKY